MGRRIRATAPAASGASLLDVAAIGMAVITGEGRFLEVNPALAAMLDRTGEDLARASLAEITHPEDWPALGRALADLAGGAVEAYAQRQRCLTAHGADVWVDLTVTNAPGAARAQGHALVQLVDVTAEVQNLQILHASARHFQVLSENSTDIVAQTDPQGIIAWVSPSVTAVLGWEAGLLTGWAITTFVPRADLDAFSEVLATVRAGGEVKDEVVRFRSTAGAYRYMSVTARPLTVEAEQVTGVALGLRDVTEELHAKRDLARSEAQFRMAMHGAPEGMAVTDPYDRIVQVNPAMCELLRIAPEQLVGHRFREFVPVEERGQVEDLRETLQGGELESARLEHRLLSSDGEVWVDHSVGVLRDDNGRPHIYVHQFADRTETRRLHEDLTFRATHDIQTGLANRASLLSRLGDRLGIARDADHVGVLFCDIDNLKTINDTLGHHAGDVVIARVADRLKGSVRHGDVVGRIGGDEFVIVLDHCPSQATLMRVAGNVHRAASGPVETEAGEVPVTVSVGAILCSESGDPDEALSRADMALYRAKRAGRNQVAGDVAEAEGRPPGAVAQTEPHAAPEHGREWSPTEGTGLRPRPR